MPKEDSPRLGDEEAERIYEQFLQLQSFDETGRRAASLDQFLELAGRPLEPRGSLGSSVLENQLEEQEWRLLDEPEVPDVENVLLQMKTMDIPGWGGSGATHMYPRTGPKRIEPVEASPDETVIQYLISLAKNLFRSQSSQSVRGKQARLTVLEALEHFDFMNDFSFIVKVLRKVMNSPSRNAGLGLAVASSLICIYITCLVGWLFRRHTIYHRIAPENMDLFKPWRVFRKIREVGSKSPETLFMFERLIWTYQLVIRIVEDIPQMICSSVYLAVYGRSFYSYFMITYSLIMMVATSIRMGVAYPIGGTLSLILSRQPPVDSAVISEAAVTTRHFAGYMAFVNFVWLINCLTCYRMTRGLPWLVFIGGACLSGTSGVGFLAYWYYLIRQASVLPDHAVLLEEAHGPILKSADAPPIHQVPI